MSLAIKYDFTYPEERLLELAKEVKTKVDDKAKYTDWSERVDIKAELKVDLINVFQLCDTESQFLLYLEWKALSVALDQYQGKLVPKEENKYQIATIAYESDRVEIKQIVFEPSEMPKIIPCRKR